MKTGQIVAAVYVVLGLLTAIYLNFWGEHSYRGFAYQLGQGLFWPAIWFPSFGKIITGILILMVICAVMLFGKSRN